MDLSVGRQDPLCEAGNHGFGEAQVLERRNQKQIYISCSSRLTSTLKPSLSLVCRAGVDSATSSGPFEVVETLLFRPGMMASVTATWYQDKRKLSVAKQSEIDEE